MPLPKVSILTRTRARPDFLSRAGACVAYQTGVEIEWVIVNNGGLSEPVEDVAHVAREAGVDVQLVHLPETVIRTKAANAAIDASTSAYLQFLDDDDTLAPDCTALLAKRLDARPFCVGVAASSIEILEDHSGVEIGRKDYYHPKKPLSIVDVAYRNLLPNNALMFKKEAALKAGGFDETIDLLEDWDFLLRLLLKGDVAAAPDAVAYYHKRQAGDSHAANTPRLAMEEAEVYRRNAYLRRDIERGAFGLGFLTNVRDPLTQDRLARFLGVARQVNAPIKALSGIFQGGESKKDQDDR